jgi:coenzyme PQQ synthesis protein D (PqqD)
VIRLRTDSVFWREDEGEIIALDAAVARYFSANPSATTLWKRLVDGATEADLTDALSERYKVSRETAETDVRAFLGELSSRGLLEP